MISAKTSRFSPNEPMTAGRFGRPACCAATPHRSESCRCEWPGTLEEARGLVGTFAGRAGFTERERLAKIIQYAAEWTWGDSVHAVPSSYARAG